MEMRKCLGAEDQLGIDVWRHKYRYQGETFKQWLGRVNGRLCDYRAGTRKEGSEGWL